MDVNTVSKYPTRFLRGVELIRAAEKTYGIPSENWPYPTKYLIGDCAHDKYYAEVWVTGMDWQNSYYAIESKNYEDPIAVPLLIFDRDEEVNDYDLTMLMSALLSQRRDAVWLKHGQAYAQYTDYIWCYMDRVEAQDNLNPILTKYSYQHASQKRIEFYLNWQFVPELVLKRPKPAMITRTISGLEKPHRGEPLPG